MSINANALCTSPPGTINHKCKFFQSFVSDCWILFNNPLYNGLCDPDVRITKIMNTCVPHQHSRLLEDCVGAEDLLFLSIVFSINPIVLFLLQMIIVLLYKSSFFLLNVFLHICKWDVMSHIFTKSLSCALESLYQYFVLLLQNSCRVQLTQD